MNPSRTENPVASTPKTPAARSPSSKKPPAGARRRTNSSAVTATAAEAAVMRIAQTMFTACQFHAEARCSFSARVRAAATTLPFCSWRRIAGPSSSSASA